MSLSQYTFLCILGAGVLIYGGSGPLSCPTSCPTMVMVSGIGGRRWAHGIWTDRGNRNRRFCGGRARWDLGPRGLGSRGWALYRHCPWRRDRGEPRGCSHRFLDPPSDRPGTWSPSLGAPALFMYLGRPHDTQLSSIMGLVTPTADAVTTACRGRGFHHYLGPFSLVARV